MRRTVHIRSVLRLLRQQRVVLLVGARQVGKTTLAGEILRQRRGPATRFDLESPRDLAVLEQPMLALERLQGLVVIDEVQHRPELFPVLRVLVDRPSSPRFLILGSASVDLLRQGSETLAGRIAFYELPELDLLEVGVSAAEKLWHRGGFPRSFLAGSNAESAGWRRDFIRTFLQRDLPQLGVRVPAATLQQFWTMLAHYHGQIWNASELARALGSSQPTARRHLDLLCDTFVVRQLRPWFENIGKRVVKSPKVYIADSGILHALLDLDTPAELARHPKVGASWEGFALNCVVRALRARADQCYFWATHAGAELDLLVVKGTRRLGFEFKRSDAPTATPSMHIAMRDLGLQSLDVVHPGPDTFPLGQRIRALALADVLAALKALA